MKQRQMVVFPKAKINLGLRITGKRSDGYHDIETIFYPVGLCDALEFVASGQSEGRDILTVTGIDTGVSPSDNIVMKAIRRLRRERSFPWLKIHLHKAIPHGAGLGGGSSDAACLIKSVNRHFGLSFSDRELMDIALETGSDCPFFINGEPACATGRGELLEPVSRILSGLYMVLVNPGVVISTMEAYANCTPSAPSGKLSDLVTRHIAEWRNLITNDFEEFAFRRHEAIKNIKDELYGLGAVFSLMSGSGSTVYGIFTKKPVIDSPILRNLVVWEGIV